MAVQNPDGPSGNIGGIIYYTRKGKRCMRAMPAHYDDAKTPAQLKHREKMKRAGRFTKACRRFLDIGYQDSSLDSSSNEARSFIIKSCFTDMDPLPVLDYGRVVVSRGTIAPPKDPAMKVEGSMATITWDTTRVKHIYAANTDKVMILMFSDDCEAGTAHYYRHIALRSDGQVTIPVPISTAPLHTWMFFHEPDAATNESKRKISDSVYLGEVGG